jgi:3-dehydrosphinganine reductase
MTEGLLYSFPHLKMDVFAILIIILPFIYLKYVHKNRIVNKNVFIVGGTSGLGLSLAKYIYSLGNKVVIASRSTDNLEKAIKSIQSVPIENSTISGRVFDVLSNIIPVDEKFDYIFYCPGMAIPGYFTNQNDDIFDLQIKINYLGMIKTLYHFKKCNKPPFKYVMISSTTALFTFPGYSSYSPTKSCLKSFFETARYELLVDRIDLKIIYSCTMNTPGLRKENETRPDFNRDIEFGNGIVHPDVMAKYCIDNLDKRSSHAYDWFTYFAMIRNECECIVDYVLFPISVIVIFISKIFIKREFKKYKIK